MKKEKLQEMIYEHMELPEGVEKESIKINLDPIAEEVNNFANNLVKAESEKAKSKAQKEMLENYGFESQEELDKAIKNADTEEEEDRLKELSEKVEKLESDLNEKETALRTREQHDMLKGLNIREDRIEKAHKLITSELGEEDDFEEVAKKFAEETPEWRTDKKDPKNLGTDTDKEGEGGEKTPTDTFKEVFSRTK